MSKEYNYEKMENRVKELELEISRLRQVEKKLKEQRKIYHTLFRHAGLAITLTKTDTLERIEFNREAHESLGYSRKEFKELSIFDTEHGDNANRVRERVDSIIKHGSTIFETEMKAKDGQIRHMLISSVPLHIDGIRYLHNIRVDITDRVFVEKALRESEERYRRFFDHAGVGILMIDPDDEKRIAFNREAHESLGYTREEFEKIPLEQLEYGEKKLSTRECIKLIKEKGHQTFEVQFKTKKGHLRDMIISTLPVNINGRWVIQSIRIDITDRKKAEENLKKSERKYRDLVENANSIILRWNTEGRIKFINPYGLDFFGYDYDEIIGKKVFWTIIPQKKSSSTMDLDKLMNEFKNKPGKFQFYENEVIRKDKEHAWVSWTNRAIMNKKGHIREILSIGIDITEKRKMEAQLVRAERLEAIGKLAGGIAHDFNNILMGIQGRTSLLLNHIDSSHSSFEHLKGIEDYIINAAQLTRQLLDFARGGKYNIQIININELIKKNVDMFIRTKKEIAIHTSYQDEGLKPVELDQGQIGQVLMNIFINAGQSMPGGGSIYIETANMTIEKESAALYEINPGDYVRISITDTGIGMDPATQKRIFEPFFTTKEMGRGTGLGLASAYGIVKNHGGHISVYSQKGEGSTFNIYLPASEKRVYNKASEKDFRLMKGSEIILLVDDEEMIIEVGRGLLENLGYTVLTAMNGKDAIEICKKNRHNLQMAIIDMIMPGMGGGEIFDQIKKVSPHIKVLLSSGYSINGQAADILQRGCNGFIQKPFNLEEISIKLREILDDGNISRNM